MSRASTNSIDQAGGPAESSWLAPLQRLIRDIPAGIQVLLIFNFLLGLGYMVSVRWRNSAFFQDTRKFWDLSEEANLSAWYSSMQWLLVALLLGAIAWRELRRGGDRQRRRDPAAWALAAAAGIFLYLSADEGAVLHERAAVLFDRLLLHRTHSPFKITGIWMFFFGPALLAAFLLMAWGARRYLRHRPRVVLIGAVGLALFVGCAAGVETLSNFAPRGTREYHIQLLVEELGEMTGATLILWATWELGKSLGVTVFDREDLGDRERA